MKDKKVWLTILYVIFILFNILLSPKLIVVNAYALIMGLIIILSIKWEEYSELLYYFVLLFSVMDFTFNLPLMGRFNIYYMHIALLILTIIMAMTYIKRRPLPKLMNVAKNKYTLFLFIFIAYMVLSVSWVENRGMAFKYLITLS